MARTDVMYIRQTRCNCRIRLSVGGWSVPSRPIPWPSAVQRPRPQHDRTSRPAAASLPPAGRAPLVSQSNNTRSSIDRMHDQKEASNVATRWCRKLSPQTFLPLGGGGISPSYHYFNVKKNLPMLFLRPISTCIDHYTRTVSEWTKDNTVSFGLRDTTRRFRDCLGR